MERILFLPGDGQGPASVDAAMRIVSAVDGAVEAAVGDIGSAAYEKYGSSLPYETLDLVGGCPVIVSGPTQESIDGRDPLADLMGQMDLYGRRRRFVTLADGLGVPGTDVTIWGTSASGRAGISETRDVDGVTISKHIGTAVYARIMAAAMTDMELRGACRAEWTSCSRGRASSPAAATLPTGCRASCPTPPPSGSSWPPTSTRS